MDLVNTNDDVINEINDKLLIKRHVYVHQKMLNFILMEAVI